MSDNWLFFHATFEDGTQIIQNQEDIGEGYKEVENEAGEIEQQPVNCFYNVLKKTEESPLISFVLANDTHTFGVDLRDGHFEVNGIPFYQHNFETNERDLKNMRIIYWRNVKKVSNLWVDPNTGEELASPVSATIVGYTIGWQANDEKGKNIEKVLKIV